MSESGRQAAIGSETPTRLELGGPLCPTCGTATKSAGVVDPDGATAKLFVCTGCGLWIDAERMQITEGAVLAVMPLAELARQFAKARRTRLALDHEAESAKEVESSIAKILIDRFTEDGINSITIDDSTKVSLREDTWPALITPEGMDEDQARFAAVQTLIAMGMTKQVNFNHMSMRRVVTDMADDMGVLPDPLGQFVRAERRPAISLTKK